jgi:hypothetical protein
MTAVLEPAPQVKELPSARIWLDDGSGDSTRDLSGDDAAALSAISAAAAGPAWSSPTKNGCGVSSRRDRSNPAS